LEGGESVGCVLSSRFAAVPEAIAKGLVAMSMEEANRHGDNQVVPLSVETTQDVVDELSDLERILATSPGAEPQQQT
jgi:hypothetical protein